MTEPGKNEISEEAKETIATLTTPVCKAFEEAGVDIKTWAKRVAKLTHARKYRAQKLQQGKAVLVKGTTAEDDKIITPKINLARGVKVKAETTEEVLVDVPYDDSETRLAALTLIGKAADWVTPEKIPVEITDPLTLVIKAPDDSEVKIMPDSRGAGAAEGGGAK